MNSNLIDGLLHASPKADVENSTLTARHGDLTPTLLDRVIKSQLVLLTSSSEDPANTNMSRHRKFSQKKQVGWIPVYMMSSSGLLASHQNQNVMVRPQTTMTRIFF